MMSLSSSLVEPSFVIYPARVKLSLGLFGISILFDICKKDMLFNSKKSSNKSFLMFAVFFTLALAGCINTEGNNIEDLSKRYQRDHDYDSLVSLLPYLNYTMTRDDVENILGESILCPVASSCTYFSNKSIIVSCSTDEPISANTCQSFSLALIVRYDLVDEKTMSPQDQLSNFSLAPVGE